MTAAAKSKPLTVPVVFTANRLLDGRVAWLGAAGWVGTVGAARAFAPEAAAEGAALARAGEAAQLVVGAYPVEVALTPEGPRPLRFREILRAAGPSVAAEPEDWKLAS